jgi:hypothetical protein
VVRRVLMLVNLTIHVVVKSLETPEEESPLVGADDQPLDYSSVMQALRGLRGASWSHED